MCKVLYIGASEPLPLIPWIEENPGFYVSELERELDREVCGQFSLPYIFYAGSHELCGCGFCFEGSSEHEGPNKSFQAKRTLQDLAKYIDDALDLGITIQMYACDDGDQQGSPEHIDRITPTQIAGENFEFKEKQFLEVVRDFQISC
jgi:hypothetical protein